jgi:hypothetical protein
MNWECSTYEGHQKLMHFNRINWNNPGGLSADGDNIKTTHIEIGCNVMELILDQYTI